MFYTPYCCAAQNVIAMGIQHEHLGVVYVFSVRVCRV